jgi:hypothetical protein
LAQPDWQEAGRMHFGQLSRISGHWTAMCCQCLSVPVFAQQQQVLTAVRHSCMRPMRVATTCLVTVCCADCVYLAGHGKLRKRRSSSAACSRRLQQRSGRQQRRQLQRRQGQRSTGRGLKSEKQNTQDRAPAVTSQLCVLLAALVLPAPCKAFMMLCCAAAQRFTLGGLPVKSPMDFIHDVLLLAASSSATSISL